MVKGTVVEKDAQGSWLRCEYQEIPGEAPITFHCPHCDKKLSIKFPYFYHDSNLRRWMCEECGIEKGLAW